jgi:nucleotide-binding universal stress UspA family protein
VNKLCIFQRTIINIRITKSAIALPFKKILVPYDGSEQSDTAFGYAAELAASLNNEDIEVVLLHVVPEIPIAAYRPLRSYKKRRIISMKEQMDELYEMIEIHAKQMLENKRKEKKGQGFSIGTAVRVGNPSNEIIEYANKEAIDLIIIGNTSTRGKLSKMIKTLGSVSRTVSEKAKCPVMIVH